LEAETRDSLKIGRVRLPSETRQRELAVALASGRLLGTLLFEVSAVDPVTYLAVAVVLTVVALGATGLPALRATRVDPLTIMRTE